MALDTDDKELLEIVLRVAEGNEWNIHYGLVEAMKHRKRIDQRNYGFVWRMIKKAAKREIRKAKCPKVLVLT